MYCLPSNRYVIGAADDFAGRSNSQKGFPRFLVECAELRRYEPLADEQEGLCEQRSAWFFQRSKRRQLQIAERRVVSRAVAVRNGPQLFSAIHVIGRDATVRRFEQWQSTRPRHTTR